MSSIANRINQLSTASPEFESQLMGLLEREMLIADDVTSTVANIIARVREDGDQAHMLVKMRSEQILGMVVMLVALELGVGP